MTLEKVALPSAGPARAGGTLAAGWRAPPGWTAACCGGAHGVRAPRVGGSWGVLPHLRAYIASAAYAEGSRRTHQRVSAHSLLTQLPGARLHAGSCVGACLVQGLPAVGPPCGPRVSPESPGDLSNGG